jgi:hypothetical protein
VATKDQLTRRTSLTQYEAEWFPGIRGGPRHRWEALQAEIAAIMQPGDELWEWQSAGFHELRGDAGLAVVRSGEVIWFKRLWIS